MNNTTLQTLETNEKTREQVINKVKSLLFSYKFFFIQLNDICNLSVVLVIVFVMKKAKAGPFTGITDA